MKRILEVIQFGLHDFATNDQGDRVVLVAPLNLEERIQLMDNTNGYQPDSLIVNQ